MRHHETPFFPSFLLYLHFGKKLWSMESGINPVLFADVSTARVHVAAVSITSAVTN